MNYTAIVATQTVTSLDAISPRIVDGYGINGGDIVLLLGNGGMFICDGQGRLSPMSSVDGSTTVQILLGTNKGRTYGFDPGSGKFVEVSTGDTQTTEYPPVYYVATQAITSLTDTTHFDLNGNTLAANDRALFPFAGTYCGVYVWSGSAWVADASFVTREGATVTAIRSAGAPTYRQTAVRGTPAFVRVSGPVDSAPTDYSRHLQLRTADRTTNGGNTVTTDAVTGEFAIIGNGTSVLPAQRDSSIAGYSSGLQLAAGITTAAIVKLPAAWLPSTSDWTLCLEYQCRADNTITDATILDISASGSASKLRFKLGTTIADTNVNGTNYSGKSIYCIHRRRLVVVASSATYRIFVDGDLLCTIARTVAADSSLHYIGGRLDGSTVTGVSTMVVLNVKVWPRALSDSECAKLPLPLDTVDTHLGTGQSNFVGQGDRQALDDGQIPQGVQFWNGVEATPAWGPMCCVVSPTGVSGAATGSHGPELTYCSHLNTGARFVKWARSGQSVTSWLGDTATTRTLWDQLLGAFASLPARPRVVRTLYWQYETDSQGTATATAYQANLARFIAELRAAIGDSTHRVTIALAADWLDPAFAAASDNNILRAGQLALLAADQYTDAISIDDLDLPVSTRVGVHVDGFGQQRAGHKYAGAAQDVTIRYPYDGQSMLMLDPDYLVHDANSNKVQVGGTIAVWASREGNSKLLPRDANIPAVAAYGNGRRCISFTAANQRIGGWDNASNLRLNELQGLHTPFVLVVRFTPGDDLGGYILSIGSTAMLACSINANYGGNVRVGVSDGTHNVNLDGVRGASGVDHALAVYSDGTNLGLIGATGATTTASLSTIVALTGDMYLMLNGNKTNATTGDIHKLRRLQLKLSTAATAAAEAAIIRNDFLARA